MTHHKQSSFLSENINSKKKSISLIRKVKGWENKSNEEALELIAEFDKFAGIVIRGILPEKLDEVIEEIEKKKRERKTVENT